MHSQFTPSPHHRRGSIMMTVIILLIVGSFAAIALLNFSIGMGHLTEKRSDSVKAFYIAESGINHLYQYFNHPEDYPPDIAASTPETQRMFYYEKDNANPDFHTFPNLDDYLENNGELVIIDPSNPSDYLTHYDSDGNFQGQVTALSILPPNHFGTPPVNCVGIIRSVGETRESKAGKQDQTILLYFNPGLPPVSSPAAIISRAATGFNGNVQPHWGDVWSKYPVDLPNGLSKQDIANYLGGDLANDPWSKARTEQYFYTSHGGTTAYLDARYHNGQLIQPNNNNPDYRRFDQIPAGDTPYYNQPLYDVNYRQGNTILDLGERFYQNEPLNYPNFNYEIWKEIAQQRGEYYSTELVNGQTQLYRNGIETPQNLVTDYMREFFSNWNAGDPGFRMIFIDTLDGNPPAADRSNLGSLSFQGGNTPHLRGLFYVNASIGITGLNPPPTLNVEKPDSSTTNLAKIWLDGILYTSGGIGVDESSGGNFQIFGSLFADGPIDARGGPDVWYNHRLKDGDYFPVESRVSIAYFKIE